MVIDSKKLYISILSIYQLIYLSILTNLMTYHIIAKAFNLLSI